MHVRPREINETPIIMHRIHCQLIKRPSYVEAQKDAIDCFSREHVAPFFGSVSSYTELG